MTDTCVQNYQHYDVLYGYITIFTYHLEFLLVPNEMTEYMGGACSMYGGEEKYIQDFGREI